MRMPGTAGDDEHRSRGFIRIAGTAAVPITGKGVTMAASYAELPNRLVSGANGVDYAYRDTGPDAGGVPLVLLQHFRGNLDSWDPALIDALAASRRVVTFDNTGVGGSTGITPDTIEQMARDAIAFAAGLDLGQADLLGFSIGSFVAQQIALVRPALVRRLILASSAPQGAAGMHGWAPEVIGAVGTPQTSPGEYLGVFFTASAAGRPASHAAHVRPDPGPGYANELGHPPSAVRRGVHLGHPGPRQAPAAQRPGHAGVRGQRRQRPDDPAPLLLPAGRPDPAGQGHDLPRRRARVLVPAPRRFRRRRRDLPQMTGTHMIVLPGGGFAAHAPHEAE